jgi:lysophospholipase L1-like esterase
LLKEQAMILSHGRYYLLMIVVFLLIGMQSKVALAIENSQGGPSKVVDNTYSIDGNEHIHIVGRFVASDKQSVRFSYPGVSFLFNAHAASISIEASGSTDNGALDVFINGEFDHTIHLSKASKEFPIFFASQPSAVKIKIINRTESWQSVNKISAINVKQGQLMAPPVLPSRNIMVIGDSVSCGSSLARGRQCTSHPIAHDGKNSYGMKLGEALDANVHLVCFGGRGIVRSWNENPDDLQAPAFFPLALPFANANAPWDHAQFSPDLILVSLGTNDFNVGIPEQTWFESTYTDFVQTLMQTHPKAKIMLTEGAMLNDYAKNKANKTTAKQYLHNIVEQVGSEEVSYVSSNYYPGDSCDPHPTTEQHRLMALDLADELRPIMAW